MDEQPQVKSTGSHAAKAESEMIPRRPGSSSDNARRVLSDHQHDDTIWMGELAKRVDKPTVRAIHDRSRIQGGNASEITSPIDAAVGLLSETAHDLRSPLTSVTAMIEMLHHGDFGLLSDGQSAMLQKALGQCQYLNALVDDLVSANGLRHGHLKTQRRCVSQREIEELVMEATAASLANHGIDLLFDGVESRHDYFVDPNVVTRLLINLVINAQDAIAAAEQSRRTILVRVADILDKGVACWSVIDTGCGMSTSSLQRLQLIASWDTSSIGTGHGLGMMISRQLAGLLFSNLTIRSRLGAGTEVSFETPLNHPSAIATAFARHRQQFRQQTVNVERQSDATQVLDESSIGIADDVAGMVELAWFGSQPRRPDRLAMGCVHLEPSCSHSIADRFDAWFQSLLTPFELAVRTSRRRWVWALDADDHHIGIRIDRIAERAEEAFGQPLLSFDEPMITSTRARNLQTLLIDRMTTAALSAAASVPGTPDEVRLGTEPIHASPVATARLDKELSRLTKRMRRQADRLKQQASAIRPS